MCIKKKNLLLHLESPLTRMSNVYNVISFYSCGFFTLPLLPFSFLPLPLHTHMASVIHILNTHVPRSFLISHYALLLFPRTPYQIVLTNCLI